MCVCVCVCSFLATGKLYKVVCMARENCYIDISIGYVVYRSKSVAVLYIVLYIGIDVNLKILAKGLLKHEKIMTKQYINAHKMFYHNGTVNQYD